MAVYGEGVTVKHAIFITLPMGVKHVMAVPGVGPAASLKMAPHGITPAKHLYVLYLLNPFGFMVTLMNSFHMWPFHAQAAYNAIHEWDRQNN